MLHKLLSVLTILSMITIHSQLQSPDKFLGYELGTYFSRHHQVLDYFKHMENNSTLIKLESYGNTNEGRLLQLVFISSEGNLNNLESIRANHLKNSGVVLGKKMMIR